MMHMHKIMQGLLLRLYQVHAFTHTVGNYLINIFKKLSLTLCTLPAKHKFDCEYRYTFFEESTY